MRWLAWPNWQRPCRVQFEVLKGYYQKDHKRNHITIHVQFCPEFHNLQVYDRLSSCITKSSFSWDVPIILPERHSLTALFLQQQQRNSRHKSMVSKACKTYIALSSSLLTTVGNTCTFIILHHPIITSFASLWSDAVSIKPWTCIL